MKHNTKKLYDETLLKSIMISTAITVVEYINENPDADYDDICDYIEFNYETIIKDTIDTFNTIEGGTGDKPIDFVG